MTEKQFQLAVTEALLNLSVAGLGLVKGIDISVTSLDGRNKGFSWRRDDGRIEITEDFL